MKRLRPSPKARKCRFHALLGSGLAAAVLLAAALPAGAVRTPSRAREDAKRFGLNRLERPLRRAPEEAAKNAFSRFNAVSGGRWKLRFDPRTGAPAALSEGRTAPRPGAAAAVARRFLEEQVGLLGVDPASLKIESETVGSGYRHVLYRQIYRGLSVEFARVKVHMALDGSVIGFNSNYEPRLALGTTPSVDAAAAARAAESDSSGLAQGEAELVILPVESTGRAHLAWKVKVHAPQAAWRYYVDALTGQVLFRYNNLRFAVCLASGVVSGEVYDVDPDLTPGPVVRPLQNQWVYIADAATRALTYNDPAYGPGFFCGGAQGKVSMSLQGPYVNAANFRGPSAHYDNGNGVWQPVSTPLTQNSYPNSAVLVSTIDLTFVAPTAVKFLPVFNSFAVGLFSDGPESGDGDIADDDQLTLTDADGNPVASYVGIRGAFKGTSVAGKVMRLVLKSNESGQQGGYDVTLSSYLALQAPGAPGASGTSSHVWTAADAPIGLRGELNLFYHLNLMHDYFFNDVNRSSAAPVSRPVLAMAHVGPDLAGAFYSPDFDNLMFGDGGNPASPSDGFTADATVTHHEYTHYLAEKIWPIQNFGQAGAISEANADYFSASSLNSSAIGAHALASIAPAAIRELDCPAKTACQVLNNATWKGEIHDDSLFLSQALWDIRRYAINNSDYATGRSCADGLVFQSLLFFPESFEEFYDAMQRTADDNRVAACAAVGGIAAQINPAFAAHGLRLGAGDAYERNDGFETATDVSTRGAVSATISPSGDADFYSFGAGPGLVHLTLNLPPSGGYFKAYQLRLFDRSHRLAANAEPPYNGTETTDGFCNASDCTTTAPSVELAYNNPAGGQFYAVVAGGEGSGVQSASPYGLLFEYPKAAALDGSIVSASFDDDTISFTVNVTSFVSVQDWRFSSAQLRDQAFSEVPNTRVNIPAQPGDFLTFVSSGNGLGRITGSVRLVPGFAARFPAVGTVHLEVFAYNVSGSTASLGLSNPINLTTSKAELTAYNNVFNPAKGEKATVKYAVTGSGRVVVKLFTVTGTYVATLLDADRTAGKGSLNWDGRNIGGAVVASGVYVVRIEGPGIRKTQKIAIVK